MAGFWPTAQDPFAERTNQIEKIVFTRTLSETPWGEHKPARPVSGPLVDEVAKLKSQDGRDMVLYGSGTVFNALSEYRLIDEYQLVVHPVLLGRGKPLFAASQASRTLKLMSARTFSSGIVLLTYQPAVKP